MSDPLDQEPTRLLDDPDLDPGLRHDLELARSHPPLAYPVEAGLARFEQRIHGASTVPSGGTLAGIRVLGWFVGAVALIGGAGALLWSNARADATRDAVAQADGRERAGAAPEVRTEEQPVAERRSSDAGGGSGGPLVRESVAEATVPDGAEDAGAAPAQPEGGGSVDLAPTPPRPTSKPSSPSPDSGASLADEAAQINAARQLLASDPGEALALMEAAERRFPNGAMIQERRGYAILALVGLGRTAEAEQRADAYLERWPNGPLSRRVREALAR